MRYLWGSSKHRTEACLLTPHKQAKFQHCMGRSSILLSTQTSMYCHTHTLYTDSCRDLAQAGRAQDSSAWQQPGGLCKLASAVPSTGATQTCSSAWTSSSWLRSCTLRQVNSHRLAAHSEPGLPRVPLRMAFSGTQARTWQAVYYWISTSLLHATTATAEM